MTIKKSLASQIVELQREELDVQKRDLLCEIEWRTREIAALQEGMKHERIIA